MLAFGRPEELWALYQETMVCNKGEIPKAGLELVRHPHPSALYPGPTKEMPGGTTSRRDEQYPTVEPLLLAHYDVAAFGHLTNGAPRYGSKVDKALSLILEMRRENPGEKVVVFSSYTNTLQILECAVRGHSELGWLLAEQDVLIDGSTNGEKRTEILRAFREDRDMFVLLLSTKANNAGLTLTEASRLILIDLPTSPSMEAQLINRIHRIGQTREVSVTRLVMKGTAEERTAKMWAEEGKGGGVGDGDDLLPVDGGMEQDNTEGIAPGRDDYATKLARVIGMDE
jgi:SNF2 family DNA or RNA helicase